MRTYMRKVRLLSGSSYSQSLRAHELGPAIDVLFATGYARNAIFHHGRLDKGVQLLTKPFSFTELAAIPRPTGRAGESAWHFLAVRHCTAVSDHMNLELEKLWT
jgi:hypothetical protein